MSLIPLVKTYFLHEKNEGPLVIEAECKFDAFKWLEEQKSFINKTLEKQGGALLRNFNITSVSEFSRAVEIFSPDLLDYVYRSTPRIRLGGKIYTSTQYPSDRTIPLHNENAYSSSWPGKIFFFSVIVAPEGGETPIADSRNVYKRIDPKVREKFEKHGVCYIRNYMPGIDLTWQEVFQTTEKNDVEEYCRKNNIEFEWKTGMIELTTRQTCQGTLVHPSTTQPVWFNQAHLFHASSLDMEFLGSLLGELGENNMPRNAVYGNGEPIESETLEHIRSAYEQEKIQFRWKKGDILILDNVLMAHGREPYKGERKVAVAMA